jgi:CBS domain containing-hemolysin-like protein
MTLGGILLISLALVILNGIYVAAEFALLAAPRPALERKAARKDSAARRLLQILSSPTLQDRYVATAQLGITIASLGLGMYGEHALALRFEPALGPLAGAWSAALAATLSLGLLTLAHIVIGEMVPKGLALQHPERVARMTAAPMTITRVLLYPLIALSNGLSWSILRLIGIEKHASTHDRVYTPEELQLIVEESEHGGALRHESGRLLRELFEFGDLKAAEVMVPRVRIAGVRLGATPDEIRRIHLDHGHTRYAVYDGDLDQLLGMVHVKDLLRRLLADEPVSATDVRRVPVVPETAALDDVLATMQRAEAHMTVVIDEHGGTAGIITLEDLFEEVVGEIDEGAFARRAIAPNPDGSVIVGGTVRLDELGQHFQLDLEHEEVDSVSGLILARLGRPPVVGDVVIYDRIRLEVAATRGRGVKEARATVVPSP